MQYPECYPISDFPIAIDYKSLIILVGPSGSGKSTLAQNNFSKAMWVSTDNCRYMICGHPLNQKVSDDAFDIFYMLLEKRLKNGYPAIADSTALQPKYRSRLVEIASKYEFSTVLVLLDLPFEVCLENDSQRRFSVGEKVLTHQFKNLEKAKAKLAEEQYNKIVVCQSSEQLTQLSFRFTNAIVECPKPGPFDIIGDIHGCHQELCKLLQNLGYTIHEDGYYFHSEGRQVVFLGDICDRGPKSLAAFEIVYKMYKNNTALYVPGNHCDKLHRYLCDHNVQIAHGLETTIGELENLTDEEQQVFTENFCEIVKQAPPYLILDNGKLVISHAGILGKSIGRVNKKVKSFCLYGDVTGEKDAGGLPVRRDWAAKYHGDPYIVYGHTPVKEALWHNRTINIDLGAVFGGSLCALRYPEKEIVMVKANQAYDESKPDISDLQN